MLFLLLEGRKEIAVVGLNCKILLSLDTGAACVGETSCKLFLGSLDYDLAHGHAYRWNR